MGKFNILYVLGHFLDTFQNNGFCNRIPDTLVHNDGGKSNGILKKTVNLGSHSSSNSAIQPLYSPKNSTMSHCLCICITASIAMC